MGKRISDFLTHGYQRWIILIIVLITLVVLLFADKLNQPDKSMESREYVLNITPKPLKPGEAEIIGISYDGGYDYIESQKGYELLEVDLVVNVGEEGTYYFTTELLSSEGEVIALGDLLKGSGIDYAAFVHSASLKEGVNTVPVYFGGIEIRQAKENGPYGLRVSISGEDVKVISEAELLTSEFRYKDFSKQY